MSAAACQLGGVASCESHCLEPQLLLPDGEDLAGDGGVVKRVVTPGTDSGTPTTGRPPAGSTIKVRFVGRVATAASCTDGTVFDSSSQRMEKEIPFRFNLGGSSLVKGLELAIGQMSRGETALVACRAEYAYGARGAAPEVSPGDTVVYDVTVCAFRPPVCPPGQQLDPAGRMAGAVQLKAVGASFYSEAEWIEADEAYDEAAKVLQVNSLPKELRRQALDLIIACWLNQAQCHLQLEAWAKAEERCGQVLKREPAHPKALYRRGLALVRQGHLTRAKADLHAACLAAPTDRKVRDAFEECARAVVAEEREERDYARRMFKPTASDEPGDAITPEQAATWQAVAASWWAWAYSAGRRTCRRIAASPLGWVDSVMIDVFGRHKQIAEIVILVVIPSIVALLSFAAMV